jgi:TonB family protein
MKSNIARRALGLAIIIFVSISSSVFAQGSGRWFEGTAPTGEEVRVYIEAIPPLKYPRRALRMRSEGFVLLNFDVNEEGEMVDLRVAEAEPRLVFDKAALQYFERMKLIPPSLNGQPVYVSDISFRLAFALPE